MGRLTFAFIFILGCTNPQEPPPDLKQITQTLANDFATADPEHPLQRIEVSSVPGEEDTFVAIRDWQEHWWGDFVCFGFGNGRIKWTASITEEPDEQSLLEVRALQLPGINWSFIEVFGMTHMGNGNYYLYQLRERALHLVLKTRAVDRHWGDLILIRGNHLQAAYRDLDGDGCSDVELTGVVEEYRDEPSVHEEQPFRVNACKKVFHWHRAQNRFIEDRSQRKGFECYGPNEE